MTKLTKRTVDAADVRERDYFIWGDELPGFGLRVFTSGKRSYLSNPCRRTNPALHHRPSWRVDAGDSRALYA